MSIDGKILSPISTKKGKWNQLKSARKMGKAMQAAAVDARMFGLATQLGEDQLDSHQNERLDKQIAKKQWYIFL